MPLRYSMRPACPFYNDALELFPSEAQSGIANISQPRDIPLVLTETEKGYQLEAELPGVPKENIKVELDGRRLTVSVEKAEDKEASDDTGYVHKRMRSYASKSITLPKVVDTTSIEATSENGVLRITLSKAPEVSPLRIDIK